MDTVLDILTGIRPDLDFETAEKLMDDGILDSFDIIAVVSELNDAFDIDIGASDLTPENFNSAAAIFALVESLA